MPKLAGGGSDAVRHGLKYIQPHIVNNSAAIIIDKQVEHLLPDKPLLPHAISVNEKGKHFVSLSDPDLATPPIDVSFCRVVKPAFNGPNKGFDYEDAVVQHLNMHGLMEGSGAGASSGNDFYLTYSNTHIIQGEVKLHAKKVAWGQMTLKYDSKARYWDLSEKSIARSPRLAEHVHAATANGYSLIERVNEYFGPLDPMKKQSGYVYGDYGNTQPVEAYLTDHGVDVLHVGSHGTYVISDAEISLPTIKCSTRMKVRQKHATSLNVQVSVIDMEQSDTDMMTEEGISYLKEQLGYGESVDSSY